MPYYLVENQDILDIYNKYQNHVRDMHHHATNVMKDVGAINFILDHRFGLQGLKFEKPPDSKHWRRCRHSNYPNHFVPKKNTREGKALYAKYKSIQGTCHIQNDLYKACGFNDAIFIGNMAYFGPALHFTNSKKLIMTVKEEVLMHKNFKIPSDITEITFAQFQELKEGSDETRC